MDPQACLRRLIEALEEKHLEEVIAASEDLASWVRRGAFPVSLNKTDQDFLFSAIADLARRQLGSPS